MQKKKASTDVSLYSQKRSVIFYTYLSFKTSNSSGYFYLRNKPAICLCNEISVQSGWKTMEQPNIVH